MTWEVVAHFDNVVAAELAKNLLEEQGIAVMRVGDETIDNAWSRNSAEGGIKLCVRSIDLGRAELLLDHKRNPLETDAEIEDALAERPDVAAKLSQPPEPFEEFASDRPVQRAFITGVLGLLFLPARYFNPTDSVVVFDIPALSLLCIPFQLYSLYLLIQVRISRAPVRRSNRWKVWTALLLNAPLWAIVVVPAAIAFNVLHDPTAATWKNTRFTGMDDHVLNVDFAAEYDHTTEEVPSTLGPMKVRAFATQHDRRRFYVTIAGLTAQPDDARAALKAYVDREYAGPQVRAESIAEATQNGFPATDVAVAYAENGNLRFVRARVVLVDRHIIALTANLPNDKRDGKDVRRFFRSATVQ